jgi:hypothetical protein
MERFKKGPGEALPGPNSHDAGRLGAYARRHHLYWVREAEWRIDLSQIATRAFGTFRSLQ